MGAKVATTEHDTAHEEPKKTPTEGSVFVARNDEASSTDLDGEAAAKYRFQMLADRSAKWSEARYWKELAIGHAWIRLLAPSGDADSWGYWPDLWGGHAVDPKSPWKSIPGKVLHPDNEHAPNAIKTYEVDRKAADKVTKAANAKESSPGSYNLFSYNCTTFVCEMAKVAGVPVPSASTMGLKNPNDLYSDIQELNAKDGLDPMENKIQKPAASSEE